MMDDDTRRRVRRRSAAQEKAIESRYRGARTPGSGSGARIRGDVRTDRFLFEAKTNLSKTQITIKLADLRTVEMRALGQNRVPVLTFDIGKSRYQVLTDDDFAEITGVDDDGGT